ncbi:hypothetical protein BDP81DRAFT_161165 [Colletotrichum phormii]|uniref:Uncharacterized protein n=1 Tax=Colletotrichum phormii TaxID=359342 RepID=A0AAJ0A0N6_9PEZI|nr:uncharacterized protein BDP81DRAFT_161165 [Colletotrichum phormii]KAK1640304.1 hypothetical protein BDP81DRAFT_161165 [Colletotrichum phormii]
MYVLCTHTHTHTHTYVGYTHALTHQNLSLSLSFSFFCPHLSIAHSRLSHTHTQGHSSRCIVVSLSLLLFPSSLLSPLTSHSLPLPPRLSHTPSPLPLIHTPLVPHLSLSLSFSSSHPITLLSLAPLYPASWVVCLCVLYG